MAERALKEGWIRAVLTFCDREWPVVAKVTHTNEWCVIIEAHAPDSCFAEPAEPPEPPGAPGLEAGERVYVSNPDGLHYAPRIEGWGRIKSFGLTLVEVEFEKRWDGLPRWAVLAAACHREGPQNPPPNEEAVFLGRYPYCGAFLRDAWWSNGRVYVSGGCAGGVDPEDIQDSTIYVPALAVARALGLVEAEPERAEEGSQADMMGLAEPKFQVGQWVSRRKNPAASFCISRVEWGTTQWLYDGLSAIGIPDVDCADNLEPCSPVLTAVQKALLPGDVVECIRIPVGTDGVPYGPEVAFTPFDGRKEIKTIKIRSNHLRVARFGEDRFTWVHNLRLRAPA